jgi:putative hydrolase of the HAD superfamily
MTNPAPPALRPAELFRGVRAVFFDAVGTLIHPDPPAALIYAEVGRRHGSQLSAEAIQERFGAAFAREEALDQRDGLRTGEERELRRWRDIVAAVLDDVTDPAGCFRELYLYFRSPAAWRLESGAERVVAELTRRGLSLGLASNYDGRLRSVAEGLAGLGAFRHRVISSEVGWRKPAPGFFAALCRSAGLPAGQILHVGDDFANDYQGAVAAGLRAVLFDPRRRAPPGVPRVTRLDELVAGEGEADVRPGR